MHLFTVTIIIGPHIALFIFKTQDLFKQSWQSLQSHADGPRGCSVPSSVCDLLYCCCLNNSQETDRSANFSQQLLGLPESAASGHRHHVEGPRARNPRASGLPGQLVPEAASSEVSEPGSSGMAGLPHSHRPCKLWDPPGDLPGRQGDIKTLPEIQQKFIALDPFALSI